MTKDEAYETAMELLDLTSLLWQTSDKSRYAEAEEAYRQAVAIKREFFPSP
jgi:hypothetical protein